MKFGVNEGMATKVGNFILGVALVVVLVWAACVAIRDSAGEDKNRGFRQDRHLMPSDAR